MFGGDAVNFFGEAKLFQPLVIGTDIWKGFGYNTVVYLAAILGVDGSLYEAAAVDGCGRFKRIWHVTLPGIKTTVALLAILSLGNVLNAGFDQIYNLYNPLVYSTGDIIDTWVYRAGLQNLQYSLATAVGLFKPKRPYLEYPDFPATRRTPLYRAYLLRRIGHKGHLFLSAGIVADNYRTAIQRPCDTINKSRFPSAA